MERRLNVLMSAYACEPNKGSEPEVGWQWALQMARFHEVTVLTRANNRTAIQAGLASLRGRQPLPRFVYHDRHPFLMELKRRSRTVQWYYLLWQRSAREVIKRLHEVHHYDLMHHVTFAGFRYPVAVWGHHVPSIWGPVGGIESIPAGLLPWRHPASLIREGLRNAGNLLQVTPLSPLARRARATTLLLASTPRMQRTFARLGVQSRLMPPIGLNPAELPYRPRSPVEGPLRMLFVGNIIALKGLDLALEAHKAAGVEATLTLVGEGSYLSAAKGKAEALGLGSRVTFKGRLPREQVLRLYADYDLFFFPSLHDPGGFAVIEAMFNEMAVLCLDCGGPAVAAREDCGIKVPLGPRPQVIAGLAQGIRWYAQNRSALARHGRAARQVILRDYDWDAKGEQMSRYYGEIHNS